MWGNILYMDKNIRRKSYLYLEKKLYTWRNCFIHGDFYAYHE